MNNIVELGQNIQKAIGKKDFHKLNGFVNKLKDLIDKSKNSQEETVLLYYKGNIHLFFYRKKENDKKKNKQEAIKCFYKSINCNYDDNCSSAIYTAIYTDLGNVLCDEHRYYEAIFFYQKAADINKAFLMPFVQAVERSVTIVTILVGSYGIKSTEVLLELLEFYRISLREMNSIQRILDSDYLEEEREQREKQALLKGCQSKLMRYDKLFYNDFCKDKGIDPILRPAEKELETGYVLWCRDHRLLLSLMNLMKHPEMLKDDLSLNVSMLERGDFIIQNWKALIQEYCHVRYVFYSYKDYDIEKKNCTHQADKNNYVRKAPFTSHPCDKDGNLIPSISNNHADENYILSFQMEELRSAYSKLYNILDKLSVLLISHIKLIDKDKDYLKLIKNDLEIENNKLGLASFKRILKINDLGEKNPYLYSFCSIYEDIVLEDVYEIKALRNSITHGFLKISWYNESDCDTEDEVIDANFKQISLDEFKERFLFLMGFVRNQFFNTICCMCYIERN